MAADLLQDLRMPPASEAARIERDGADGPAARVGIATMDFAVILR